MLGLSLLHDWDFHIPSHPAATQHLSSGSPTKEKPEATTSPRRKRIGLFGPARSPTSSPTPLPTPADPAMQGPSVLDSFLAPPPETMMGKDDGAVSDGNPSTSALLEKGMSAPAALGSAHQPTSAPKLAPQPELKSVPESEPPKPQNLTNLMKQSANDAQSQANQAFDFSSFGF